VCELIISWHGKGNCTSTYHISALLSLVYHGIIQGILSNVFCKSDFVTQFETIFLHAEHRILTGKSLFNQSGKRKERLSKDKRRLFFETCSWYQRGFKKNHLLL
jgi:hypothetical protein